MSSKDGGEEFFSEERGVITSKLQYNFLLLLAKVNS